MSVLIIGGAGYIGSHAARYFYEQGRSVVVVDNLLTGHRDAVGDLPFYELDIRDEEKLYEVLKKEQIKSVLHFAARSLVGESVEKPAEYYENNVGGMLSLLSSMLRANVKNIIFSSTAAVYGEPAEIPITENCPTKPLSPYGKSKLMMEQLIADYAKAYDISYVALRYFNAAGASKDGKLGERHRPETHLIPIILDVALGRREKLEVYGSDYPTKDGTCIRDYIHIDDLISAHYLALDYLEKGGKSDVFNLSSESGFSNLEILEAAKKVCERPINWQMGERRAGDPAILIADSSKAERILGWRKEHSNLAEIIGDAWNFHRNFFS
ncbi:MAG: UDP-glucose 4-epimerase GalE [Eubacteriales bacterium]|nr:UDP-glucose 4-epimerase GalE [Eubacteriales bacterium]